jgi:single-strand DNA-binding protein
MSWQQVVVCGNLGRDAELRYTSGGQPISTFSVATTERWKDKSGQRQERTEWHRIVLWGKAAESLQEFLVKGKQVLVSGTLQTRKWEKDGVERYTTEIKARDVVLLGGGGGGGGGRRSNRGGHVSDEAMGAEIEGDPVGGDPVDGDPIGGEITDDDIPF